VTHEWGGLEEIKSMVQEIHVLKPYNAMIQIPFFAMQTVSVHDSRCGVGVPEKLTLPFSQPGQRIHSW
jgi:hypothetical protein